MPHPSLGVAAIGALLALATSGPTEAAAPDIAGFYRVGRAGIVMTITDCGDGRLCGRVAALGTLAATDAFNPIPANRSRPLCGLVVMTAIAGDDDGWRGRFYDPQVGGDYTIRAVRRSNGTLSVSSHTDPPFLMRTYSRNEVWEPIAPPPAECGAPTPIS